MKKKKWNRFLSVVVTAAMLVAPLQGFSFVDDLFTTAGVTTKASAQDIAQTDTSQDRKSTRLNSSHQPQSRMPSSA